MKPYQTSSREGTQATERKRNKGARTKVEEYKQPKRGHPHRGKGTTKNQNLHESYEAYLLKKGEVNPP
jgi:hypothetical protein